MANLVKFVSTSASGYAGLTPDSSTVYFISDTKELYKGSTKFSAAVEVYATTRPATGVEGKIYVDSTNGNASIYTGGSWVTVAGTATVSQTVLSGETATTDAVSGAAVKNYVEGLGYAVAANVVSAVAYDAVNKNLTVTKNGADSTLSLTNLGVTLAYDGATGVLTLKDKADTVLSTINIPLDNFVKSGAYNDTTDALVLTLQDDTTVSIPAADLVKLYEGTDTSTVDITIQTNTGSNNTISAVVKVSAVANNAITIQADGLHVDSEAIRTIGLAADEGKVVTIDSAGKLTISTKTVASLATETYVTNAVSAATVSLVDTAANINTTTPSATKAISEQAFVQAMSWTEIV